MARIAGINIPPHQHAEIGLTAIYGIGRTRSLQICEKVGVKPSVRVSDIEEDLAVLIQKAVQEFEIEGDLRRRIAVNIKRLRDIKCYRGLRHRMGLPVRGQRTKTNARTRKGKKRSKAGVGGSKT